MTKIGDVAQVYDGPHATPKKIEHGPYFLSISSLVGGSLDLSKSAHLSQKDFEKWTKRVTPREGDVLFSYETRLGEAALMPPKIKACLGRRMGLLRPDVTKVIPEYLLYAYLSPGFQQVLKEKTIHGATVERISLRELPDFPVWIPPLAEQKKVVEVLQSLYSKIHLNTQINQTLEQMAQALFKSWFVDFDPVIDNALEAGNPIPEPLAERAARRQAMWAAGSAKAPARLPAETRRLFPDSFEENEVLGWVPTGWKVGIFADIANNIRNSIGPNKIDEKDHYVGLEHIDRISLSLQRWGDAGEVSSNKSKFEENDVLFGKLRPYFHKVCIAPFEGICSTDILVLRAKEENLRAYVSLQAFEAEFVEYANLRSTGTRMPRASWKDISQYELVIPEDGLLSHFQEVVGGMLSPLSNNIFKTKTLAQLRDTLLPKLLSGELQLPEAEAAVQTALESEPV